MTDNLQYNIQGWGTVSQTVKGSETLYSQRLSYYDAEKGSGLYNGNISEWRIQQGTNAASTYRYGYDGLGRLTTSSRYAGSGTSATNSWCERGIDYDLNGNIVTLQRFGSNSITAEDDLSYSYNGNRLVGLTGSSRGAELNAAYSYDAGGNMLYDGRRGLGISYNILNLPAKVVEKSSATAADGAVKAEYLYSVDGIKQRVVDATGSNGYLYLGTLVLSKSGESYTLSSTGFGGGRIIGTANNSCLAYYYGTDHLGSVRVITDGSGSVVERNDYYPLGMRTSTGNSYPQLATNLYKYNGKEVQTVGGLGFTDYGARMYDDFTGRWFVPDPLAEKYSSMSPYMYCGGNPISMVDIYGMASDWYLNLYNGTIENRTEDRQQLFKMAYVHLTGDDASVGDIENALSERNYNYEHVPGEGIKADTDKQYRAWKMMQIFSPHNVAAIFAMSSTPTTSIEMSRVSKASISMTTAEPIKHYRSFTYGNFRYNLAERTGIKPPDEQAHHVFPNKFKINFDKAGIDINNPKYGIWLEKNFHLQKASKYNKSWEKFFERSNAPNKDEIFKHMEEAMEKIYEYKMK